MPEDRAAACAKSSAGRPSAGTRPSSRSSARDPWLQPYTIDTVERLAKSGIKRLAIVSPGFSADCLETLEELDMENRAKFLEHGGEKFTYVPCLNDSPLGMHVIEQIVRRELAGWI